MYFLHRNEIQTTILTNKVSRRIHLLAHSSHYRVLPLRHHRLKAASTHNGVRWLHPGQVRV